ncbi:nucleotidyltransferase domain-containing protein [Halomonas sp. ML-15]|uniref:type VII toxin-antitoxin system MntA family adenylyltransferase antitoxin n=1 Tax=Halomonas sp. ML-15 TaxID=2773305 RepID=UPI0017476E42|nr:nucleotidyltransferase domain-containing protein [Halomonas sp. ML-15]MBD3896115.1 nucleotidyltransferase domain-containing protein [Halomonas sp. ML-15]
MSEQDPILAKLVKLAAADGQIEVVWLYGSRAKGTHTESSDYDLAVAFNVNIETPLERRLRPELLAQQWADALGIADDILSIVDINQAPLPLAMAVIRTGRAICVRSPLRLAREENRITSMWELDYLYHQRHYGVS